MYRNTKYFITLVTLLASVAARPSEALLAKALARPLVADLVDGPLWIAVASWNISGKKVQPWLRLGVGVGWAWARVFKYLRYNQSKARPKPVDL
jgi:hypothetical protein